MTFRRSDVHRLFEEGRRALGNGDNDRAVDIFERVTAFDPDSTNAWFNLGLAYKLKRDWSNSSRCCRRAAEVDPTNREAFWNLGVAATALEDWATARWAWRNIGVDPGAGAGPPELQLGPSPIRLRTGEVVWGERLDPCRARIANVPLPQSGHRWGDIVMHDVVPRGERQAWGKTWGVFDELIRLQPGPFPTLESEVKAPSEQDTNELLEAVAERGFAAEDWTLSVRRLCETCSLGSPHEHTGSDVTPIWLPRRRVGFAGPQDNLLGILDTWALRARGREFGSVREARTSDEGRS
jgi:hypothetical protein